ncbi:MAG TPA: hypothetical protein VLL52_05365 [Anaerolineae bacterium]|nr:hypothetical protein [Anaerolineae bacterium]
MSYDTHSWWTELKHGGLLIAPTKLTTYFPASISPLTRYHQDQLRRQVTQIQVGEFDTLSSFLTTVLEELLGLDRRLWFRGSNVDATWAYQSITGEMIKPRRVWVDAYDNALPVFVDTKVSRLGVGKGRRTVTRVIEWLRKAQRKVALLTNGRQWRLIHAGVDYDAWCEWDINGWFEGGQPSPQVDALRILLGSEAWQVAGVGDVPPLLAAIQESRQGQAELSAVLGERVRQAVELLVQAVAPNLETLRAEQEISTQAIYISASRLMMRCVIILFAEARDLLPRNNPIYHHSYGLQGLREELDRRAGGRAERLRHTYTAWPRLLALFDLVYHGSDHEALPIHAYGGDLFATGDKQANDPVRVALTAFETIRPCPSDATVYRLIELLTRSKIKVRQGNRNIWVEAPVDFSDLSSEYIGILYQGLLDFELRQAAPDEPMIFLNLGDEPVLPLSRLQEMDDKALASLMEKLKAKRKPKLPVDDGEDSDDEDSDDEEIDDVDGDEADETDGADDTDDETIADEADDSDNDAAWDLRQQAQAWAIRAVKVGNLVTKPRSRKAEIVAQYEADVSRMAEKIISRRILPGGWFLVRWGGTRKGSGTFYTRPQLGIPLIQRTLQPLAYEPDPDAETGWQPQKPEKILDLKVCDAAMGSGSLLAAALRYLTNALYESLYYHGRIIAHSTEKTICRLADGKGGNSLLEESLPLPPDHEQFDERLKARLKRYVVERCIYGVDLDPLAVELAKLALWIETMDRELPFEFLDHKLKCGNALVGCWLDRFQEYPVMAWERDGGDSNHNRFVHHFYETTTKKGKTVRKGKLWTQRIKDIRNDVIKAEMAQAVRSQGMRRFAFSQGYETASELYDQMQQVFTEIYALPLFHAADKAALYRERIQGDPAYQQLKRAFDSWCAVWFWPGDELDHAPTPLNFHQLPATTQAILDDLVAQYRFFHWELEFPDVFVREGGGFDALVQNPPWDILKPKSQEFFANIDPLYRTYGKQEALGHQQRYFGEDMGIEKAWLDYNARFKAYSNWKKYVAYPFGDNEEAGSKFSFSRSRNENRELHNKWRYERRQATGYADPEHPFRHQGGGDLNSYKMFLELFYVLLRPQGQFGAIVPSGIYTDKGTGELRTLFLEKCRWQWLFGFENRNKLFDIHRSFKFCCLIIAKEAEESVIQAAFMHHDLVDWEEAEKHVMAITRQQIQKFSPNTRAILETRTPQDLAIIDKIYSNGRLLGDPAPDGWQIQYRTEFHMTNDSKLFPPRPQWEKKGYQPDQYGHWLKGDWQPYTPTDSPPPIGLILSRDGRRGIRVVDIEDIALPLYEGRMIGQFDFSQKGWVSGKGRTAVWREIPWEEKVIEPQFLMGIKDLIKNANHFGLKLAFLSIGSATNARSMVSSTLDFLPSGHSISTLTTPLGVQKTLLLQTILSTFIYDFLLRNKLGGINISYFIIEETSLLSHQLSSNIKEFLISSAMRLNWGHWRFARFWMEYLNEHYNQLQKSWFFYWAVTYSERLRIICALEAVIAYLYGLDIKDLHRIFYNCDQPASTMSNRDFYRTLDPKGFWRVDKNKDPELRHTILSLVAFHDLQEMGLEAFLAQNEGEGWLIPEKLRLVDYGLGHDERAQEYQPVASRLGPRFLPWQLEADPAESWAECERHAANLNLLLGDLYGDRSKADSEPDDNDDKPVQLNLFDL